MTKKFAKNAKKSVENPGIDPGTSHLQSERSTTWANSPMSMYMVVDWSHVHGGNKHYNFLIIKGI